MTHLPSRDVRKAQAKRLRADLDTTGTQISHSESLEPVANQWGMRDWNTLAARADVSAVQWYPGQRASGRYLGLPFNGMIKAARLAPSGLWSLTVQFDATVDVVESQYFTSLRQQLNVTINAHGETPRKISDGQPHMSIGPE